MQCVFLSISPFTNCNEILELLEVLVVKREMRVVRMSLVVMDYGVIEQVILMRIIFVNDTHTLASFIVILSQQ